MTTAINPATNQKIKEYEDYSQEKVNSIIEDVHKTHLSWKTTPVAERSKLIARAGEIFLAKKQELAKTCSEEMGKPLSEAVAEVEKCAVACKYYAEHAEQFLKDEKLSSDGQESYISYQPLGVILAVMPWNFPYWQVIRFAAPNLTAGNTAVLKHSSNTPGCALALEKVFEEAGFPKNAFRTLIIGSKAVEGVIKHPLVKGVTLTGSTDAGKKVAAQAASVLKKTVLELGGSDPYLILEDADLESAAKILVKGRLMNAGQSCISPKRLIIVDQVFDQFEKAVLKEIAHFKFGDPMNADFQLGSMSREDLRDELHEQVKKSIQEGAKCLAGGEVPKQAGAFYPPTVLSELKPGMTAFDEELFGPVVCLIRARDEKHGIELANTSNYGLGGGVFSKDLKRAKRIAETEIQSGGIFINDFLKSDPRLPFGGIKESGYGRELSQKGMYEFMNVKTIFVK
jgi:succinate-semialdehyde dehydrogenase/glutarate-semialdehyde dehydrogenase